MARSTLTLDSIFVFNPFLRIEEPILDKFGCHEVGDPDTLLLGLRHGHISRRSHPARTARFCSADLLPTINPRLTGITSLISSKKFGASVRLGLYFSGSIHIHNPHVWGELLQSSIISLDRKIADKGVM